jgi:hypothetical protein
MIMSNNVQSSKTPAPAPVFGAPTFSRVIDAQPSERYGRRSIEAVKFELPILPIGWVIIGSIYCTVNASTGNVDPTVYISKKAIKAESPESDETLKIHVETACAAWNGWDAAYQTAFNKLAGMGRAVSSPAATAPRLVGRPLVVATHATVQPTA